MLTAAIATPKISFETPDMISSSGYNEHHPIGNLNARYRCCPAKPVHGFPPIGLAPTALVDDNGNCFIISDSSGAALSGQAAQQRRGAADRGQYRRAAGATAVAVIQISGIDSSARRAHR
jgi:hypothetical protein